MANTGRKTFRKVITSPELTAQINPKNTQLMERFLKNFSTKHSPKSVVSFEIKRIQSCNALLTRGALCNFRLI